MRYLRLFSWGRQLLILLMIVMASLLITSMLFLRLHSFTSYSIDQVAAINAGSSPALIRVAIMIQGLSSIVTFLLPAALFAFLAHPDPSGYLGLRRPRSWFQPLLAVTLVLGAMPILQELEVLISHINFGPRVREDQAKNDAMMSALLTMPDLMAFFRAFLVIAIVPALGEELFFRGLLMRVSAKKSANIVFPLLFSSLIFALSHGNIYGYLSIFLAGALLGYIYYITSSLWCGIAAHLCFNGSQVVITYFSGKGEPVGAQPTDISLLWLTGGAIVFAASLYLLLKNKTPLPANWTNDFADDGNTGSGTNFADQPI